MTRFLLIVASACVVVFLAVAGWRFTRGEVFSAATLAKLKPGMTTNEVVAIIGPPSSVLGGRLVYRRAFMYNVGLVSFDEAGHLTYAIND